MEERADQMCPELLRLCKEVLLNRLRRNRGRERERDKREMKRGVVRGDDQLYILTWCDLIL